MDEQRRREIEEEGRYRAELRRRYDTEDDTGEFEPVRPGYLESRRQVLRDMRPRRANPFRMLAWIVIIVILLFVFGLARWEATVEPEAKTIDGPVISL